jgi:copper chaperone CopZ
MTHTYNITGMTCDGCVAKAKSQLLQLGDVTEADVRLAAPQATISMQKHIPVHVLQQQLSRAGNYIITEADNGMHGQTPENSTTESWWDTYKPILLIGIFISGITLLIEFQNGFDTERWMANFMGGFFVVFSFFKLLNLAGFAESYATYDIIAKKWQGWGYVYTFVELGLGIAFLLRWNPLITNIITFSVMSVSIIGVIRSVMNKQQIRCACLGTVFNLPMSTVTIVEDALMIAMSGIMILTLL